MRHTTKQATGMKRSDAAPATNENGLQPKMGAHTKRLPTLETSHSQNFPSIKVPSLSVPRTKMCLNVENRDLLDAS
jgi:hypothetical protein